MTKTVEIKEAKDQSGLDISEADSEIEEDHDLVVDSRIGRILSEKIV